jgi:hypothetical protein
MDVQTLGAALALAKKTVLPKATAADAGETLVVGNDGAWTKGTAVTSAVSVNGTTLTITTGGE